MAGQRLYCMIKGGFMERLYPVEVHGKRSVFDMNAVTAYLGMPPRHARIRWRGKTLHALLDRRQRRNFMAWMRRHGEEPVEVNLAVKPLQFSSVFWAAK